MFFHAGVEIFPIKSVLYEEVITKSIEEIWHFSTAWYAA
jgi:hypothetical protein